jgi:hypothetical protein
LLIECGQVEGVELVLCSLLGADAETAGVLLHGAGAFGSVEYQQGVAPETVQADAAQAREGGAGRREAELDAFFRLAALAEAASRGGGLVRVRVLAEHRPLPLAPPGAAPAPPRVVDARVGLLSTGKRARSLERPVPPPPRTNRTRRVPHPVLIGHAASLTPY